MSSPALEEIESELSDLLEQIQTAIQAQADSQIPSLCQRAEQLLAERNRLCKLGKSG